MRTVRTWVAGLMVLAGLGVGASPAAAEWMFDLYGGAAWVQSADIKVQGRDSLGVGVDGRILDVDTDTGFSFGTRGGYWFESLPFLGLGLDLFYWQVPVPAQVVPATVQFTGEILGKPITVGLDGNARVPSATLPGLGFSPDLWLRWPLMVSQEFPKGRVQPYVTAGPAWAFSLDTDKVTLELGGKVSVGTTFMITPNIGIFSEYRFAFFPSFEFKDRNLNYEADLKTHKFTVGVSFRF